jgi:molybdenum cofactor cytidylyltransferase
MAHAPSLCAVILAAGASTRMGRDKALLPWPPSNPSGIPGTTFLSAAIRSLSSHTDMVLVVAGANTEALAPSVYAEGARLVENPDWEQGQFSSLRAGLQEVLGRGRDAAIVTLVDRPPVEPATLQALLSAFERALGERLWAVVPEHVGKHGHPILVAREMMEAFLKAPQTSSARDVEHAHADRIRYLPVNDPRAVMNVDTPEDYAALTRTPPAIVP